MEKLDWSGKRGGVSAFASFVCFFREVLIL